MALTNTTVNVNVEPNIEIPPVNSVFNNLPEGPLSDFIISLNNAMSNAVSTYIPENMFTSFFINNPLLFLIIFFMIAIIVAVSLKFMQGAWKLPFAMLLDIIDMMAIASPGMLDFIAAGGSFLMFYLLEHDLENMKYVVGFGAAAKCLAPVPGIKAFPLNTVMMLILIILH